MVTLSALFQLLFLRPRLFSRFLSVLNGLKPRTKRFSKSVVSTCCFPSEGVFVHSFRLSANLRSWLIINLR